MAMKFIFAAPAERGIRSFIIRAESLIEAAA
jgi:hypothetical protein